MSRRFAPVFAVVFLLGLTGGSVVAARGTKKPPPPADDRVVVYNQSSHKFHCPTCEWALKCDKHCVTVTLAEAKKRGGVPCKVCGGECAAAPAQSPRRPAPAPSATPREED